MYVTMLDASKAFDKINHSKLFTKLIDRGCPSFIVRILYYWYITQTFTFRWSCSFSEYFNVYMYDLSVNFNKLQIGYLYAGTIMNHMMYADDLYDFSPSVAGLRKLTDCCAEYV